MSGRHEANGADGRFVYTHRETNSREHKAWMRAKARCAVKPGHPDFQSYAGRGISMCHRWAESFEAFVSDMGRCPDGKTLDRIENDRGYEPGNCRWATASEQARNRSTSRLITIGADTKTVAEWAEASGLNYMTLFCRIHRHGWSPEKAVGTPARHITRRANV